MTWRGLTYINAIFTPKFINNIILEMTDIVLRKSSDFYQNTLSGKLSKHNTNLADGIESLINVIIKNSIFILW